MKRGGRTKTTATTMTRLIPPVPHWLSQLIVPKAGHERKPSRAVKLLEGWAELRSPSSPTGNREEKEKTKGTRGVGAGDDECWQSIYAKLFSRRISRDLFVGWGSSSTPDDGLFLYIQCCVLALCPFVYFTCSSVRKSSKEKKTRANMAKTMFALLQYAGGKCTNIWQKVRRQYPKKKTDGKAIKYKVAFLYTQPIENPGFEEKK